MRMSVMLVLILSALPAAAQHGGVSSTSTAGGQLTMSPEGMLTGKFYVALRFDYARFRELSDDELHNALVDGRERHSIDHEMMYALDGAYGVTDLLTVGLTIPYRVVAGFREAELPEKGPVKFSESVTGRNIRGLGDIPVWAHLALLHSEVKLGVRAGVEIPFGRKDVRTADGDNRLDAANQPGSGSYDFFGGAALGYVSSAISIDASLTGQYNTRGSRDFKIGYNVVGSVGGSLNILPEASKSWFGPTVDAQAFWKARDIDSGHGIRDSSGWEMTVAPGLRLSSGLIVLQACVPFLLRSTIYERNHQKFRVVVTLGLVF